MHLLNASAPVSIQSLSLLILNSTNHPQWFRSSCLRVLCASVRVGRLPLDPVLRLVVVHGLLSLSQEGVHALICTQEPIHAHDGFEGQDAAARH